MIVLTMILPCGRRLLPGLRAVLPRLGRSFRRPGALHRPLRTLRPRLALRPHRTGDQERDTRRLHLRPLQAQRHDGAASGPRPPPRGLRPPPQPRQLRPGKADSPQLFERTKVVGQELFGFKDRAAHIVACVCHPLTEPCELRSAGLRGPGLDRDRLSQRPDPRYATASTQHYCL